MVLEEQVEQVPGEVPVPGIRLSVVQLNMIRGVEVTDNTVNVILASTALANLPFKPYQLKQNKGVSSR